MVGINAAVFKDVFVSYVMPTSGTFCSWPEASLGGRWRSGMQILWHCQASEGEVWPLMILVMDFWEFCQDTLMFAYVTIIYG